MQVLVQHQVEAHPGIKYSRKQWNGYIEINGIGPPNREQMGKSFWLANVTEHQDQLWCKYVWYQTLYQDRGAKGTPVIGEEFLSCIHFWIARLS